MAGTGSGGVFSAAMAAANPAEGERGEYGDQPTQEQALPGQSQAGSRTPYRYELSPDQPPRSRGRKLSSPGTSPNPASEPSPLRAPNLRELTQHLVTRGEKVKELERQNKVLEKDVVQLKTQQGPGGHARKADKSELRSTKKLYPDRFVPGKDETFRSWAEEFLR